MEDDCGRPLPQPGDIDHMSKQRGELNEATKELEKKEAEEKEQEAGPSIKQEEEGEDFSSSASSWVPTDDSAQSGDSDEGQKKKIKLERCTRQQSKKIITRSNKATVIPKNNNKTLDHKEPHSISLEQSQNITINKSLPNSIMRNTLQNGEGNQNVEECPREIKTLRNTFKLLFNLIEECKPPRASVFSPKMQKHLEKLVKANEMLRVQNNQSVQEEAQDEEENREDDEFNRSDDNVLITNKYSNVAIKTNNVAIKTNNKDADKEELVPIGSGKTLIPKDKWEKVNWKSYTVATRTLLRAAFTRRTLATHSLTGKKSPAFQNKPAKMCLNPKIVSDIILTIMDKFKVRENLVRIIITTKCADECKMWKTQANRKKSKNNENIPPPATHTNNMPPPETHNNSIPPPATNNENMPLPETDSLLTQTPTTYNKSMPRTYKKKILTPATYTTPPPENNNNITKL